MKKNYKEVHRYHFDGKQIEQEWIDQSHLDILDNLINNVTLWNFRQAGNGLVIGLKHGDGSVTVFECANGYTVIDYDYRKSIKGVRREKAKKIRRKN